MYAKTITHPLTYQNTPTAHCATICKHNKGVFVAYYIGRECSDEQQTVIEYWENDNRKATLVLPYKTGNAVLIPVTEDKATLIVSFFNDTDGINTPNSPVQRWMFCSNWKMELTYTKKEIKVGKCELLEVEPTVGLLTRCQAIVVENKWYLPIYREHNCYGSVLVSEDGWYWKELGRIGESKQSSGRFGNGILIQPTIWYDGKFKTLSRDVSRKGKAWYSESEDCMKWSDPIPTSLSNYNNSVSVLRYNNDNLVVWNYGPSRSNLVFGILDGLKAIPLIQLNEGSMASYPNIGLDEDGNVTIVHTENGQVSRHIKRHIIDQAGIDELKKIGKISVRHREYSWWKSE